MKGSHVQNIDRTKGVLLVANTSKQQSHTRDDQFLKYTDSRSEVYKQDAQNFWKVSY